MFDSDDAARDALDIMDMITKDQPNPPWRLGTEVPVEDLNVGTVMSQLLPAIFAILQVAVNHSRGEGSISIMVEVRPVQRNEDEVLQ